MNVMDMDGTLYLEEHLTDAKLKDKWVSSGGTRSTHICRTIEKT